MNGQNRVALKKWMRLLKEFAIATIFYSAYATVITLFILFISITTQPADADSVTLNLVASFLFFPVALFYLNYIEKLYERNNEQHRKSNLIRHIRLAQETKSLASVLSALNIGKKTARQTLQLKQAWQSFETTVFQTVDHLDPAVLSTLLPVLSGEKSFLSGYLEQTDQQALAQWRDQGIRRLNELAGLLDNQSSGL